MNPTFRSNGIPSNGRDRFPLPGADSPVFNDTQFAQTLFAGGGPIPGVTPMFTANQLDRITDAVFEGVANAYSMRQDWFRGKTGGGRFDRRRDIDDECGFEKDPISAWMYWDLSRRDALARRVNEVMAKETWQVQPSVYEKESGKAETPWEVAREELSLGLRGEQSFYKGTTGDPINGYLSRLDEQAGIGRYGVLFYGLDDGLDPSRPAKGFTETGSIPIKVPKTKAEETKTTIPTSKTKVDEESTPTPPKFSRNQAPPLYNLSVNADETRGRKLKYLRVFPEHLAVVARVEGNQLSPRAGWPTHYNVTFNDPQDSINGAIVGARGPRFEDTGGDFSGFQITVHWSRVLHFADNLDSSEWAGDPRCHPVLNDILTAQKPRWASGEGYWKACFTWLFLTTQPNYEGAGIDRTAVRNVIEQWMNGLQRANYLGGLSPQSVAPNVIDPTPFVEMCIQIICIKLGIPIRIFKGSERGELASSQDDESWNDRVRARQNTVVTPRLVAPFHDRAILLGCLPVPDSGEYKIDWPDLASQSDEVKAKVFLTRMQAFSAAISGGVDKVIPPRELLTGEAGYTDDEADALLDAAEDYTAEQEEKALEQQKTAIDAGLAPDPTKPPPGKEPVKPPKPTPEDEDAKTLDLAARLRPSANVYRGQGVVEWDFEEDRPVTNAKKAAATTKGGGSKSRPKLTGGQWVTLDNGVKVYLKSGKVAIGPKPVKDIMNDPGKGKGGGGGGGGGNKDGGESKKSDAEKTKKEVKADAAKEASSRIDEGAERLKARTRSDKELNTGVGRDLRTERRLANSEKGISATDTVEAIREYTSDTHYMAVNKALRDGADINSIPPPSLKNLNEMAKQELKKPVMTYRGVGDDLFKSVFGKTEPGGEVEMRGMVSTSLASRKAAGFGNTILEIKAKRGLYVADYSEFKEEHELVQAHGTRYRFLGVEEKADINISTPVRIVRLEEI